MSQNDEFELILTWIQKSKNQALQSANVNQILLYWEVGKYVAQRMQDASWGDKTVLQCSEYLQQKDPQLTNFTKRGLYRMRQFYEAYPSLEIVSAMPTQISWTHNLEILSQTKTLEERQFYLRLTIQDHLNHRELRRNLKSAYFERSILANELLPPALEAYPRDVSNLFKDSYVFEFLDLQPKHAEKDLQKALVQNVKQFILELGKDFLFVGEAFRVQVGMKDYEIDLLFFHRELSCLVAIELKIEDFEPSFLGQLNFYLEALDSDVKKSNENPSIGILICRNKDREVVEYALRRNIAPTLIADYTLKLIDKSLLAQKVKELFDKNKTAKDDSESR